MDVLTVLAHPYDVREPVVGIPLQTAEHYVAVEARVAGRASHSRGKAVDEVPGRVVDRCARGHSYPRADGRGSSSLSVSY